MSLYLPIKKLLEYPALELDGCFRNSSANLIACKEICFILLSNNS